MADVTNQTTPNPADASSEEAAFEEVINGAIESLVPTLAFPFIQQVTDNIKENSEF